MTAINDLPPELFSSIARGATRRMYRLLLGAGASAEVEDASGSPLPLASGLVRELANVADLTPDETEGLNLTRLASFIESSPEMRGKLKGYLERRFTNTQPPAWHIALTQVPWANIFTLNVDDSIEATFKEHAPELTLVIREWDEPWAGSTRNDNDRYVVYIHGRAATARRRDLKNIVFSMQQYLRAATTRQTHHRILLDELATQPFICVGARLVEEWDLSELLEVGTTSMALSGYPSIIVLRSIDRIDRRHLEAGGFVVVESGASAFFERLASCLETENQGLTADSDGKPDALKSFERDFAEPTAYFGTRSQHDFHAGYDPHWDDIQGGRAAAFEAYASLTSSSDKLAREKHTALVCLMGPPFSGKSTGLLYAGMQHRLRGREVFVAQASERLDVPALAWRVRKGPPAAFLFENAADVAADLDRLFELLGYDSHNCAFLGTERESRRSLLFSALNADCLMVGGSLRTARLTDKDIDHLLEKLADAGRLGFLADKTWSERREHFRTTTRRNLFDGLADLEGGRGFRGRLKTEYSRLSDSPELRDAYLAACISYVHGYVLPLAIITETCGASPGNLIKAAEANGPLAGLVSSERGGLKPHHRRAATLALEELEPQPKIYEVVVNLSRHLSPYVTREAIRRRTIHHRVLARIMDHEVLAGLVGAQRVDRFYDEVRESFDWNARYWEQRALSLLRGAGRRTPDRTDSYDRAESYATTAVGRNRDPFTLNTLGTILMRKAVYWYPVVGSDESVECLERGIDALRQSRDMRADGSEHPYMTFFRWALEFGSSAWQDGTGDHGRTLLRHEWSLWIARARSIRAFEHSEVSDHIERLNARWIALLLQ